MMVAALLTFCILIYKVQSQLYGPGPLFPGPWGLDPGLCGPCGPEIGQFGPYCDPYANIPTVPNIVQIAQPTIPNPILGCGQSILNNLPAPSFIQNQIPPCANLINQPLLTNTIPPCPQPLYSNVPQLTPSIVTNPAPCTTTAPVVTTTVVDNTLANSLANAIQLLIVSNLIEHTLGSSSGCNANVLAQALGLMESPCVNNFELVSPDFYPAAQVISCSCPDIMQCNPQSVYQSPCDAPCTLPFGSSLGIADCNCGFDSCGTSNFGTDSCSNLFGSSVIPSYGCLEPAVATIAPMAVEVPFPASIPAQMVCNFGYMPTNIPCVSVNVEPLPYDSFNNLFGNFGKYVC